MKPHIVISFFISVCLTTAAFAEPRVDIESAVDQYGNRLVRSITPDSPGPYQEAAPLPTSPCDQEVLWTVEHATAIANDVAVSGNGDYLMTGWYLNSERTSLYEVQGTGIPLWEYYQSPDFYLPVASSDDGSVLASIGDIIPLNVWLDPGPNPSWQYGPIPGYKGSNCDVSDDGAYVVSVYKEDGGDNGKLVVHISGSVVPLWEVDFDATSGLHGVEISEDNQWIVVSTYYAYYIYDYFSQTLFATVSNYSQTPAGIDDDAEWLVTGDFYGQLHVYQRTAVGYTQQWQYYMGGWVTAVDISSDASTVIGGNFTYSPANAGKVQGFSIDGTLLWTYDQYGDYIADAALCDDGSVGVAGSWGALDYTFGDVFTAFDMATGDLIFQLLDDLDEPGSIFEVAISEDGGIAVCGGKAVHARTFGNGGEIYSIDLGGGSDINVDLTYLSGSPVPPEGGPIFYALLIENVGSTPLSFDGWIQLAYESQPPTTLILRNFSDFQPGWVVDRPDMVLPISSAYPAGNYEFIGKVGISPDEVWDMDSFPFTKLGDDGPADFVPWIPDDMPNPFDQITEKSAKESEFKLTGCYPNPFNPTTLLSYQLQAASHVELSVYDVSGRKVAELADGWRDAGRHEVTFDGSHLASGIYVYQLQAGDLTASGKLLLMK